MNLGMAQVSMDEIVWRKRQFDILVLMPMQNVLALCFLLCLKRCRKGLYTIPTELELLLQVLEARHSWETLLVGNVSVTVVRYRTKEVEAWEDLCAGDRDRGDLLRHVLCCTLFLFLCTHVAQIRIGGNGRLD